MCSCTLRLTFNGAQTNRTLRRQHNTTQHNTTRHEALAVLLHLSIHQKYKNNKTTSNNNNNKFHIASLRVYFPLHTICFFYNFYRCCCQQYFTVVFVIAIFDNVVRWLIAYRPSVVCVWARVRCTLCARK